MHEPVRSQLEDILQGRLRPGQREVVVAHLKACPACEAELGQMSIHADWLRALRVTDPPEPSAGFYARVINRVEAQARPSFWELLVDPVFGRRLVYATGTLFLLMASFLLATSNEEAELAYTPVEIIAQPEVVPAATPAQPVTAFGEDMRQNREHFLATMASFSE
jgi:anti-sigma factor RsiW